MDVARLARWLSSETIASPPPGGARRSISILIGAYLLWQIFLPVTFYLHGNRSDERFAWRMFSELRRSQKSCALGINQTFSDPTYRPPRDLKYLPRSSLSFLQRGRTAVGAKILHDLCKANPVLVSAQITRTCPAADGSRILAGDVELDCFTGVLRGTLEGR